MKNAFLLADMGGTNIRFAIFDGKKVSHYQSYKCQDFETLFDALSIYKQVTKLPETFILAIPGIVQKGMLSFVNNKWTFSEQDLKSFGFKDVILLNDFEAVAFGLTALENHDLISLKDGERLVEKPALVMGAGTGLGVGVLLPQPDSSYKTLPSEAGHIAVSITNETEEKIYAFIRQKCGRVSAELLLSGQGIQNIHAALTGNILTSEEIVFLATQQNEIARQTMRHFFSFWGDVAGDLALAFLAKGGIYLTGNIIQTDGMLDLLKESDFLSRFANKGRHCQNLQSIPVSLIMRSDLAFDGLKQIAKSFLNKIR